ncbi:MAG TPA: GDYXXLXY domain-containing protein [Candidatus Thermoplasmatota archaeon]|nr:GDYXXLXY domain-containing protein [Candidatus Thermoplasmatota archaeon]
MRRSARIALALAVPALLAAGYLAWAAWPSGGTPVLLATRPVDPPDPLRGDYVDIAYDIGTLRGASGLQAGDTVFVVLRPGGEREPGSGEPYWQVDRWSRQRPSVQDGEACLRGKVQGASGDSASVRYGIESYFVAKDERFEDWRGKHVSVLATVRGCTARIDHLRLDGERWDG